MYLGMRGVVLVSCRRKDLSERQGQESDCKLWKDYQCSIL